MLSTIPIVRTKQELIKYKDQKTLTIAEKEKNNIDEIRKNVNDWTAKLLSDHTTYFTNNEYQEYTKNKLYLKQFDEAMNKLSDDESDGTFNKTFDYVDSKEEKQILDMVSESFAHLGYDLQLSLIWRDGQVYLPYENQVPNESMIYKSTDNNNVDIEFFSKARSQIIGAKILVS